MFVKTALLVAVAAIVCQADPTDVDVMEKLYDSINIKDYESAVAQTLDLALSGKGDLIAAVVLTLAEENHPNLGEYTLKLYFEQPEIIDVIYPLKVDVEQDGTEFKVTLSTK